MRKQLDSARLQAAEKTEEIENQASFIDIAKEAMQSNSSVRETNSKL